MFCICFRFWIHEFEAYDDDDDDDVDNEFGAADILTKITMMGILSTYSTCHG